MTQMDVYWVMNYLPLDITPYAPIHLEKNPDNSLIDRYITGRGPDKYVPFYLILCYASKNIYLSQEQDKFTIKSSYVYLYLFLQFVSLIEERYKYYEINIIYKYFSKILQCHLFTMLAVFWCRHRNTVYFVGIDLVLSTKIHSASYINQSAAACIIYRATNIEVIVGVR